MLDEENFMKKAERCHNECKFVYDSRKCKKAIFKAKCPRTAVKEKEKTYADCLLERIEKEGEWE